MASENDETSKMTYGYVDQIPAAITILGMICTVGSFGNLLVLSVYAMKNDKQTATLFILVLATSDVITCLILIPFTISMEYLQWRVAHEAVCKVYYLFNNSAITFSSLLISAIALDRYFCICHPFLRVMSVTRAKLVIGMLASFAVMIGLMSTFQIRGEWKNMTLAADNSTFPQVECVELVQDNLTTTYESAFYQIVQKTQASSFLICILFVIVLYILIFLSVLRVRRKRDELKGKSRPRRIPAAEPNIPLATTVRPTFEVTEPFEEATGLKATNGTPIADAIGGDPLNYSPKISTAAAASEQAAIATLPLPEDESQSRRVSVKFIRDTHIFQNMKTAAMLFVVALVYIITFLPANLMANTVIKLFLPVFYMYYLNNAANPIIYCFMNKNFRDDVTKIFGSKRPSGGPPRNHYTQANTRA